MSIYTSRKYDLASGLASSYLPDAKLSIMAWAMLSVRHSLRMFLIVCLNACLICAGVKNCSMCPAIHRWLSIENPLAKLGSSVKKIAPACLGLNSVMSCAVPWYITLGLPASTIFSPFSKRTVGFVTILLSPNQALNSGVSGASRRLNFGATNPS